MKVGIVGATGVVGREVLLTLEQRNFNVSELRLFSSPRGAAEKLVFKQKTYPVHVLNSLDALLGLDVCFFTAGSLTSDRYVRALAATGTLVIDNASLFRMQSDVPLVIPEVNGSDLEMARSHRIVANPNCTTAQMVMALKPLHDFAGLERVVLSSYQAVSGRGKKGVDEFHRQIEDRKQGRALEAVEFPHPIAYNAIPQVDKFVDEEMTGEEQKVIQETRKILHEPSLRIQATCVRVPVMNCHSESVSIETKKEITPAQARDLLSKMPGVKVLDRTAHGEYPVATQVSGKDDVFVGRIRRDPSVPAGHFGLSMWIVGDNLRKGAALNAVQIAEEALKRGLFK